MDTKLDIEYIELRNFLSYGDYVTRLDVANLGPVLVLGEIENEDGHASSNGAGKSSLLSAFIWCLFGRTIINPNPGDKVTNWFVGKNCYVKIKTADGWEIIRTRAYDNHSELLLRKDGDDATQSTNTNAQKKLEELFGLDYEIFTSSVFCGQFGKSFLEMAPAKRKETIERLLGLDRLNGFADQAKSQYQQIEQKQSAIRSKTELLNADINRQNSRLNQNLKVQNDFETDRTATLTSLQTKILDLQATISSISVDVPDIEELQRKWDLAKAITIKLDEYQNTINQNRMAIASLEKDIEKSSESLQGYENWSQQDVDLEDLIAKHQKADLAEKKIEEISEQVAEISGDIRYFDMELNKLREKLLQWENKSNTECESCGQDIDENHVNSQCLQVVEKIKESEAEKDSKEKNRAQLQKTLDLISQIRRPEMSISEAQRINDLNAKVSDEVVRIKDYIKTAQKEKTQKAEENQGLSVVVESALEKFEKVKPNISLEDAKEAKASLDILNVKKENLEQQIETTKNEVNPYIGIVSGLKETIEELQQDLKIAEKEIEEFNVLFQHYKYIYKSYSDRRKIKSWLLSELIPFLNDRVAYYLGMLNIDIDVKFSTTLNAETDRWGYEFCSGGERKKIDLAIMFGLYDLYMSIYGQQCNIMVLDEIDSRLDKQGVEAFAEIVNDICTNDDRPRPSTIFVISHKQELESLFPSQITIKKQGSFSHIDQTVFSADQK